MEAKVDRYRRVTGDYVIGTDGNKQLKFGDIPFQIDPDLVLPYLRLKTTRSFHAQQ